MSNYKRSKEEYIAIVEKEHEDHGATVKLPLTQLHQDDDTLMVMMPLETNLCHLLFQRLPRDMNNPEGIQRAFKPQKIEEIARLAKQPGYTTPGSIVVSIDRDRPWTSVNWDKDERRGWLTVDLKTVEKNLRASDPDETGALDESKFMIGYMIDAHHRTEGHFQANKPDFEMAAVAYLDLPRPEMAEVFVNVNEKQEKPSPTHVIAMRNMAGLLKGDAKTAYDLAETMNKNPKSILYERVKLYDGRLAKDTTKTYVNLKPFVDLLQGYVIKELLDEPPAKQQKITESYFRAWSTVFDEAWQDEKNHVLVKAMGFSVMCRLFPTIYGIALHKSATPNQKEFESVLQELKRMTIDPNDFDDIPVPDGAPLDWESRVFGVMSSGKGIAALARALDKYLKSRRSKFIRGG